MVDSHIVVVEPDDNVATAIRNVDEGETVEVGIGDNSRSIDIVENIEFGHKMALEPLDEGETVRKYGKSIGNATEHIDAGEWVHVHNVESNYGRGDLTDDADKQAVSE